MPKCCLLAVSRGSALDESSKCWSLFSLVQTIRTNAPLPIQAPVELHVHWKFDPAEFNVPYEMRILLVPEGRPPIPGKVFPFRSSEPRHQVRIAGIPPFPSWGAYEIGLEWRKAGSDDWTPIDTAWPVDVVLEAPRGTMN